MTYYTPETAEEFVAVFNEFLELQNLAFIESGFELSIADQISQMIT